MANLIEKPRMSSSEKPKIEKPEEKEKITTLEVEGLPEENSEKQLGKLTEEAEKLKSRIEERGKKITEIEEKIGLEPKEETSLSEAPKEEMKEEIKVSALDEARKEFAKMEIEKGREKQGFGKEKEKEYNQAKTDYEKAIGQYRQKLIEELEEKGLSGKKMEKELQNILTETVAKEANELYDAKTAIIAETRKGTMAEKIKNGVLKTANWYRGLKARYKLGFAGLCLGGSVAAGAIGGATGAALLTGAIFGSRIQRVFGGAATFVALEAWIKASQEKKERKEVIKSFGNDILKVLKENDKDLNEKIYSIEKTKKRKAIRRFILAGAAGVAVGSGMLGKAIASIFAGVEHALTPPPVPPEGEVFPGTPGAGEAPPVEVPKEEVVLPGTGTSETVIVAPSEEVIPPGELGVAIERGLKSAFSLELGKGEVPPYLERVFHMMSVDHMKDVLGADAMFGEEEGAKSLNVAANLVELAKGHSVVGINADEIKQIFTFDSEKNILDIKDYSKFNELIEKLHTHSNELWDKEVLQKGAVAYLDDIKKGTWEKIIHAQGLEKVGETETGIIGHKEITPEQIMKFEESEMVAGAEKTIIEEKVRRAVEAAAAGKEIPSEVLATPEERVAMPEKEIPATPVESLTKPEVEVPEIVRDIDKIIQTHGESGFVSDLRTGAISAEQFAQWYAHKSGIPLNEEFINNLRQIIKGLDSEDTWLKSRMTIGSMIEKAFTHETVSATPAEIPATPIEEPAPGQEVPVSATLAPEVLTESQLNASAEQIGQQIHKQSRVLFGLLGGNKGDWEFYKNQPANLLLRWFNNPKAETDLPWHGGADGAEINYRKNLAKYLLAYRDILVDKSPRLTVFEAIKEILKEKGK